MKLFKTKRAMQFKDAAQTIKIKLLKQTVTEKTFKLYPLGCLQ